MGRIARTTLRIILVSLCVLVCGGFLASIGKVHVVERLRYTIEHRYVWTSMIEVYARPNGVFAQRLLAYTRLGTMDPEVISARYRSNWDYRNEPTNSTVLDFKPPEFLFEPAVQRLFLPWWLLVLVLGGPGALVVAHGLYGRIARKRAKRSGRCAACGYDLRATHDRCPECGQSLEDAPIHA